MVPRVCCEERELSFLRFEYVPWKFKSRAAFAAFLLSQTFFKVKKTTRMEKVFNTYAQRKGVSMNSLRFLLDGERINADSTPKTLDLEDQDQIDCMLEQQGGRQ